MLNRKILYDNLQDKSPGRIIRYAFAGTNKDIIKSLLQAMPKAVQQTKNLGKFFIGRNDYETIFNVWNFAQKNFTYTLDEVGQKIQLPSSALRSGKIDCKSFAVFINSILYNCNIPNIIRFVSEDTDSRPTHVYSVAYSSEKKNGLLQMELATNSILIFRTLLNRITK